jgi:hypothetical protein
LTDQAKLTEAERRRIERKRREASLYPQGKPTIDDIVWEVLDKL